MQKIKDFIKNNHDRIILTIGAILIAGTSFAIGRLSNDKPTIPIEIKENSQLEAKIQQPQQNINTENTKNTETQKQETQKNDIKQQKPSSKKTEKAPNTTETTKDDCTFVASSRGHKYYNADSSSAKSLSEQNKICFPDAKAAEKAGYEPSASLNK